MNRPHLNRALVLEQAERAPDGAGGFVTAWSGLGTLWAAVTATGGRALQGEERPQPVVTWRITLRAALPGNPRRPRPDQRLREGDRIFIILAVAEDDPGGRYLNCYCREEITA